MSVIPFSLVSAEDPDKVFAYGIDIELLSGREVVVFRRDPGGQAMFGIHQSAESALRRYNLITPLELVWETDCLCDTREE